MRTVGISVVRNEADVIEAFVRHHTAQLDRIVVVDHRSQDNTAEIVRSLADEGLAVELRTDGSPAQRQTQLLSELMHEVAGEADWVVPLDADEFLVAEGGSVREVLAGAPSDRVARVPWRTYVPAAGDDPAERHVLRRIRSRRAAEPRPVWKVVVPRAFCGRGFRIDQGNHAVVSEAGDRVEHSSAPGLFLAHLPVRSGEQLQRKVLGGWPSHLARVDARPGEAFQWKALFDRCLDPRPIDAEELYHLATTYGTEPGAAEAPLVVDPLPVQGGELRYAAREVSPLAVLAETAERLAEALRAAEQRALDAEASRERVTSTSGYRALEGARAVVSRAGPWGTRRRTVLLAPARAARLARRRGPGALLGTLLRPWVWVPRLFRPAIPATESADDRYRLWLALGMLAPERLRAVRRVAGKLPHRPRVTVVVVLTDGAPRGVWSTVTSIRRQLYDRWEVHVVGTLRDDTLATLRDLERSDPRIRAETSDAPSGDLVAVVREGDELRPTALYEVVRAVNRRRDAEVLYTDEDRLGSEHRPSDPWLKPAWSPDLALGVDYVSGFAAYRREVFERAGGLRAELGPASPYDLALRATELTDRIGHVAMPVVSRTAGADEDSVPRVLEDAVARRGLEATVEPGLLPGRYRVRRRIPGSPRIAILIPTRDRVDLLRVCVESVRTRSTYGNHEVVVIDNDSSDPETLEYLRSFDGRVLPFPGAFEYARMMNRAVEEVPDADLVVLLNNDTEVISPGWLEAMLEHASRPEIAAVGARLLFPDGRPQHEGIVVGVRGIATNVDHGGYAGLGESVRNCSAVTAACMMVRREVFRELGGFEERLRVAYNDVDFCLRARDKGYLVVYTPHALLYHHERASRGAESHAEDDRLFLERWGPIERLSDPYYNPNFSRSEPFRLDLDAVARQSTRR